MNTYQFCGFWDIYCSVDIAAWVQAIGSIVGLGVTIVLYRNQIKENRVDKQAARDERRKAQALVANQFSEVAHDLIMEGMSAQTQALQVVTHLDNLRSIALRIEDIIVWSRIFIIDSFSKEELASFVKIRGTLHALSTWLKHCDYDEIIRSERYIEQLYLGIESDLFILDEAN